MQTYRESNVFTKEMTDELTKYFFGETKFFVFPHCVLHCVIKRKSLSHKKLFVKSSKYSVSKFFRKTVAVTKLVSKNVRLFVKPTLLCEMIFFFR